MTQQPIVEIANLSYLSLRDVSLTILPGERVALVGESGIGKSVLLGCVLGFNKPTGGTIRLFGSPATPKQLAAAGVGVAFQQPGLFDAWSIADNLRLASSKKLSDEELSRWLATIGLADVDVGSAPGRLSGGQQKRVALARALLRGTQLLILDEPTSGLDRINSDRARDLLTRHLDDHSPALLMVTHDHELAFSVCTRVLHLSDGRLRQVPSSTPIEPDSEIDWNKTSAVERQTDVASHDAAFKWGLPGLVVQFIKEGLPLSVILMALLGAILVAQTSNVGPVDVSRFVPQIVVTAVFRELAPLVVGLLIASRIGARMSAQIAGMAYTAQLDSMRALGLSSARLLLLPYALAACLAFPLCIVAGASAATFAASQSAAFSWAGLTIGSTRFMDLTVDAFDSALFLSCLCKGIVMGLAIAMLAYAAGMKRVRSAPELGRSVTRAAVHGAVAVVLVDITLSWLFFAGG